METVPDIQPLFRTLRDLADSERPADRVALANLLAERVDLLTRHVVADANSAGLPWSEIGRILGISKQAAHQRFSTVTVVSPEVFDALLAEDEEGRTDPRFDLVATRYAESVKTRPGVLD